MNRLLELVFMLVIIILISVFASSLRTEGFDVPASSIDSVSSDLAMSGLSDLSSSPTNTIKSFIKLVPTLDDLLSAAYLKPEYTQGLVGANSISARTCSDDKGNLTSSMDSNKINCGVLIDLQPYHFKSTSLTMKVLARSTTSNTLVVIADKSLLDFLLLRPVFTTIDGSKPFCLDLARNTPSLYTTFNIPTVNVYNQFPVNIMSIPIKDVPKSNSNFFPVQTQSIISVLQNKMQSVMDVTGSRDQAFIVEVLATLYYVDRDDNFGNSLVVDDAANLAYFSDNSYMTSLINQIKSPTPPLTVASVSNPVLSVCFTVNITRPGDLTQPPWWSNDWHSLLKIGSASWSTCDEPGRGVLLVEMRPQSARTSTIWNWPYSETPPVSGKYYCLDFTNVEASNSSGQIVDVCGGYNRSTLWLPTGVDVNIVYIVSPSVKIIVAKWYDLDTKQRQVTFVHLYNTGSTVNDIYRSMINLGDLCVDNQVKRLNLDPNTFKVSGIEVSFGMRNLYNWMYSSN